MNFGGVTNDAGSFRMKIQRKIQGESSIFTGSFSETERVMWSAMGQKRSEPPKDVEVENAHKTRLPRFFLAFICDFFFCHWGVELDPLRNGGGGLMIFS